MTKRKLQSSIYELQLQVKQANDRTKCLQENYDALYGKIEVLRVSLGGVVDTIIEQADLNIVKNKICVPNICW